MAIAMIELAVEAASLPNAIPSIVKITSETPQSTHVTTQRPRMPLPCTRYLLSRSFKVNEVYADRETAVADGLSTSPQLVAPPHAMGTVKRAVYLGWLGLATGRGQDPDWIVELGIGDGRPPPRGPRL